MAGTPKIWYHQDGGYTGENPPFYDLNGIPWYDKLTRELPEIKNKVQASMDQDGPDIQQFYNPALVEKGWWGGAAFMYWKIIVEDTMNKAGNVFDHFREIPGLVSLSISILRADTHLNPHNGYTDAVYRIHIPIYIPAQLPDCGIKIAGITKPWVENEMIAFCDAHLHEAWNMTNAPRVVMIMDVLKEEFLPQADKICATALADIKLQTLAMKYKFLIKIAERMPAWMRNIIKKVFSAFR